MKTEVKVLTRFTHGRDTYEADQPDVSFTKGDAEGLAKAGLVEVIEEQSAPQAAREPAVTEVAPKMAGDVQNKMDEPSINKTVRATRQK